MVSRADEVVRRARALIGVPFRPHGRGRGGLDCVGLAAASFGASGVRDDYALRCGAKQALVGELARCGLRSVERREPGDLLLMQAGPGQLHLGVWTGEGLVHADAGLRRVVERPGPVPWPVLSAWRDCGEQDGAAGST